MGIYIKGIEMPKSCESCPCKTADAFGGLGCQATGYIPLRKANQDRPDNCPLVPVPPHGKLIDADTLNYTMLYKENWMSRTGVEALAVWKKDIDASPTIIGAEEG